VSAARLPREGVDFFGPIFLRFECGESAFGGERDGEEMLLRFELQKLKNKQKYWWDDAH
jgi:hypothetical protein